MTHATPWGVLPSSHVAMTAVYVVCSCRHTGTGRDDWKSGQKRVHHKVILSYKHNVKRVILNEVDLDDSRPWGVLPSSHQAHRHGRDDWKSGQKGYIIKSYCHEQCKKSDVIRGRLG